ncbi:MAG: thiamine-phosphate kinase [Methanomassiliicoccaceae archaeon]|jgi:thiamine-monophosphate kinase|nr:thiamine-phosphate kinase [Methanomassiliicoccaceae archaeon]
MVSLKELWERETIDGIRNVIRKPPGLGPGDDSAVIPSLGGDIIACVDSVTFARHFPKGMKYEELGWTAAAVSISDLAAMGAVPLGLLAALTMPPDLDSSSLYDIMAGMDACAEAFDTYIYGGDTKFGCGAVSCTAIGSMEGRKPMLRSGAKPGDIVAVTGSLGSAAAGFFAIEKNISGVPATSLMTPVPRVAEGIALSSSGGVTSCIDLSDGLAEGARSICGASRVGMDIHMDFLPEGDGVDTVFSKAGVRKEDMMLYWGGDYELLFTFDKDKRETLYDHDIDFSIIGIVTNDHAPYINYEDKREVMGNGWY